MSTAERLAGEYAQYTDEFLVDSVRRGVLTDVAAGVARQELAARGVDVDARLGEQPPPAGTGLLAFPAALPAARRGFARAARFPLRAVLGLESFWVVLLVGAALHHLYGYGVLRFGISQLVGMEPVPGYALPLAFGALAVRALLATWIVVALWRCTRRFASPLARVAGIACAILYAIYALRGTVIVGVGVTHYLGQPPHAASLMDAAPGGR